MIPPKTNLIQQKIKLGILPLYLKTRVIKPKPVVFILVEQCKSNGRGNAR